MEEEKRYSYKWMYAVLLVWFVAVAIVMVRFGLMAMDMPDAAKELNVLINKKVMACSKDSRSEECSKAAQTLKDFQRRWFASSKFKAAEDKPR